MGATSGPRWLSAFGGDACACILYGGLAGGRWLAFSTVVWVCTVDLASGWFGSERTTEGACGGAGRRTGRYEAQARVGIAL